MFEVRFTVPCSWERVREANTEPETPNTEPNIEHEPRTENAEG